MSRWHVFAQHDQKRDLLRPPRRGPVVSVQFRRRPIQCWEPLRDTLRRPRLVKLFDCRWPSAEDVEQSGDDYVLSTLERFQYTLITDTARAP